MFARSQQAFYATFFQTIDQYLQNFLNKIELFEMETSILFQREKIQHKNYENLHDVLEKTSNEK
jgi:hypothetical protein